MAGKSGRLGPERVLGLSLGFPFAPGFWSNKAAVFSQPQQPVSPQQLLLVLAVDFFAEELSTP